MIAAARGHFLLRNKLKSDTNQQPQPRAAPHPSECPCSVVGFESGEFRKIESAITSVGKIHVVATKYPTTIAGSLTEKERTQSRVPAAEPALQEYV